MFLVTMIFAFPFHRNTQRLLTGTIYGVNPFLIILGGRRDAPMFPISLWNINARVNHNLPRTTNHVEGCHSKPTESKVATANLPSRRLAQQTYRVEGWHSKPTESKVGTANLPSRRLAQQTYRVEGWHSKPTEYSLFSVA